LDNCYGPQVYAILFDSSRGKFLKLGYSDNLGDRIVQLIREYSGFRWTEFFHYSNKHALKIEQSNHGLLGTPRAGSELYFFGDEDWYINDIYHYGPVIGKDYNTGELLHADWAGYADPVYVEEYCPDDEVY